MGMSMTDTISSSWTSADDAFVETAIRRGASDARGKSGS